MLEPLDEWNNTLNGTSANIASRSALALEGREFYNNAPRPGYKPYPYPHPFQKQWPPLAPTDKESLSVPEAMAARVTGEGDVELAWKDSTDNEAVAGYYVWLNGARVTTVSDPGHTRYTLRQLRLRAAQHKFAVSAFDAAGNESDPSASVFAR